MGYRGYILQFIDLNLRSLKLRKIGTISRIYEFSINNIYIMCLMPLLIKWGMTPQALLEVDPSVFLNNDMVEILRKAILHEGCEGCVFKPITDLVVTDMTQCTCDDNPIRRELVKEFHQTQESTSPEVKRKNRILPIVISMTVSLLLSVTFNEPFVNQHVQAFLNQ